jgi:hypothetical protein
MGLLIGHVRRAVAIGNVIQWQRIEAATLADTLDGLSDAVFLVGTGNRIGHANACGLSMLTNATVVRSIGSKLALANTSKLALANTSANKALSDLVASDGGGKGNAVTIPQKQLAGSGRA